jgi:hypothetical protein
MRKTLPLLWALSVLLGAASAARADATVIVLGLRSIEGDDEFAITLTGALRHAATQVQGWDVSDRDVSLAQMSLAHGCDEPDAACLEQIAGTLGSQRILYGTVRRTGAGAEYNFAIALYMYNAEAGQIEGSLTDSIPRTQTDVDDLRSRVRRYINTLTGASEAGTLRVHTNVPGATVSVDGEPVGTTDDQGAFVGEVPSGRRQIDVTSPGHQPFRSSVTVSGGVEMEIEVVLVATGAGDEVGGGGGGGGPSWLGIGLVGGGAVFLGLMTWSMLSIESLDEGSVRCPDAEPGSFTAYKCHFEPTVADTCDYIDRADMYGATRDEIANARDVCGEADTMEVLQYVFLGLGIASAGAGAFLIATSGGGEDDEHAATTLEVQPRLSAEGGRLDATLRF